MRDDKDALSFGRYLKAIRLEKKISLEQVAAQTRVGLGILLLVEQEDHEQLPAEVFVKGFLRSYAAAVGADGDEAVRRYESRLDIVHKNAEPGAADGNFRTRLRRKPVIVLGLILCVLAVSLVAISFLRHPPPPLPTPPAAAEKPAAADSPDGVRLPLEPVKKVPEKLSLQITARENVWIKVIVDEKESTEYSLKSGDDLQLEATTGYNLLIGNAGGINITLNGKSVVIPGESGQVVNIHLP